jgi:hypothetical protein
MQGIHAHRRGRAKHARHIGILAALLVAVPVQAQLGGLVRRARDNVAAEAGRRSGASAAMQGESVAFNETIVELDAARLEQVERGLQAGQQALAAPGGRRELAARRDALNNQIAALSSAHGKEIDEYNRRFYDIERCRNDAFRDVSSKRQQEFNQRAMQDPVLQRKIMDLTQRAAEAQAKGDATAYGKLEAEAKAMYGATRADTAVVDGKCGALPAKHPRDAEIAALQKQSNELEQQIRAAEQSITQAEAQASGMTERQFAMARERIEMYLARAKHDSPQRGFSASELKALDARRSQLERLF